MWPAHSVPFGVLVYFSAHSTQYLGNQAIGPAYHRPYSVSPPRPGPLILSQKPQLWQSQALLKGLQAGRA